MDGFCLKSDTFELWGDWQTETWLATFPVETKKKGMLEIDGSKLGEHGSSWTPIRKNASWDLLKLSQRCFL